MAVKPSHEKLVSVEKLSILALATLLLFIFQSTPIPHAKQVHTVCWPPGVQC